MSIRTKLALTLFVTVALFLGMDHLLRRASFFASFAALEHTRANAVIERSRDAFEGLVEELTQDAEQIATGEDDKGSGPLGVHVRIVIDATGHVFEHHVSEPSTGEPLRIREFPSEQLSPGHPVLLAWLSEGPPKGLFVTRSGPMVIGTAELSVGDRPRLLVLGRLVDAEIVARLRAIAGCPLSFTASDSPDLGERERLALAKVTATDGVEVLESDEGGAFACASLRDIRGFPSVIVRAPVDRGELDLWDQLERYQLLTAIAVAVFFPLVLLVLIQAVIVGPLFRLTAHASEIGSSDDASQRLALDRGDEIGLLANEIDGMLAKLERSRINQQRTARFAGRSEVAVGVMHNVGNLANSLVVSAGIARDTFNSLDAGDLRAVYDEFLAHSGDLDHYLSKHARGKHLLQFLGAIVDRMETDVEDARQNSESVVNGVQGITELIQALQSTKSVEEVVERVDLRTEIDSALRLAMSSTQIEVEVVQDLAVLPEFTIDRQRLLETLVAVMTNALEAMETMPIAERFLVLRLSQPSRTRARIEIRDCGVGIERHQLSRIFAAGVSTKSKGTGLGLHLASLAATELGGSLSVASDGQGTGATFTLEMPLDDTAQTESEDGRDAA